MPKKLTIVVGLMGDRLFFEFQAGHISRLNRFVHFFRLSGFFYTFKPDKVGDADGFSHHLAAGVEESLASRDAA